MLMSQLLRGEQRPPAFSAVPVVDLPETAVFAEADLELSRACRERGVKRRKCKETGKYF